MVKEKVMRLLTSTRIECYLRNRYKEISVKKEDSQNLLCSIKSKRYKITITDKNLIKIYQYSAESSIDIDSYTKMEVTTQTAICVSFSQLIPEMEGYSLN